MSLRRSDHIATRLLPEVFAGIEADSPLTVVDLGPGCAATLNFLGRYRAKVFFADLPSCLPLAAGAYQEDDRDNLIRIAREHIGLAEDTRVDICLLWDYLHLLDTPRLEVLSAALAPHVHRGSRAHGFGALHSNRPPDIGHFGIADLHHLTPLTSDAPFAPQSYHTHTQMHIAEHFTCFRIARGTLLQEGRLEILFEAS